jgi:hypothetical protein
VLGAAAVALPLAGCAAIGTSGAAPGRATATPAASAAAGRIDQLLRVAQQTYAREVGGSAVRFQRQRIAHDPVLLGAQRTRNLPALRAEVARQQATPHKHISRVRVLKGSTVLADSGVPFVVAGAPVTLRDASGHALGRLDVSIQDEIGFVRLMHRNYPVDVVVRGRGANHVRTSLPAAARATLPATGRVTVAGRRYDVRSFGGTALGGEAVRIWILGRA